MVTLLNGTPMFEWYDGKVCSIEWTPKRHVSLKCLTISSIIHTILCSILNIIAVPTSDSLVDEFLQVYFVIKNHVFYMLSLNYKGVKGVEGKFCHKLRTGRWGIATRALIIFTGISRFGDPNMKWIA